MPQIRGSVLSSIPVRRSSRSGKTSSSINDNCKPNYAEPSTSRLRLHRHHADHADVRQRLLRRRLRPVGAHPSPGQPGSAGCCAACWGGDGDHRPHRRQRSVCGVLPPGSSPTSRTAVGAQVKFSDTELGDLNNSNINVIRPVVGSGICVMGARTRKGYGPDRYVSGRRTLIDIKESLRAVDAVRGLREQR